MQRPIVVVVVVLSPPAPARSEDRRAREREIFDALAAVGRYHARRRLNRC